MTEVTAHPCVLPKVPIGVDLLCPPQDVEVVGVEDKPVCPVYVVGCHREQERKGDTEPEVYRGPEIYVVPIHARVKPPRRDAGVKALEAGISYGHRELSQGINSQYSTR